MKPKRAKKLCPKCGTELMRTDMMVERRKASNGARRLHNTATCRQRLEENERRTDPLVWVAKQKLGTTHQP